MKFDRIPAPSAQRATRLWVMLPGAYMKPADFIAAGFAEAVARRGLPHEIALLDTTIPEIADASALAFLQDFLRSEGAVPGRPVWLIGISLGAHLAMACLARGRRDPAAAAAAGRVAGACLIAPYLGPRDIAAEIEGCGGLDGWTAPPEAGDDIDREIWGWLKSRPDGDFHLAYGGEDRFGRAHALMAQALPRHRVDVVPGGHVWPVWTELWNRYLDRLDER